MITLGAGGDSYYEYLLKEWLQDRRRSDKRDAFKKAIGQIQSHMLLPTAHGGLFVAEIGAVNGPQVRKMDHLVCFLPTVMALGAHFGVLEPQAMEDAERILETCILMYALTPTGLAAEITKMDTAGRLFVTKNERHNLLRPETAESLFTMWRLTKRPRYRRWAWTIFNSFRQHERHPSGAYASLISVFDASRAERAEPQTRRPRLAKSSAVIVLSSQCARYGYVAFTRMVATPRGFISVVCQLGSF